MRGSSAGNIVGERTLDDIGREVAEKVRAIDLSGIEAISVFVHLKFPSGNIQIVMVTAPVAIKVSELDMDVELASKRLGLTGPPQAP